MTGKTQTSSLGEAAGATRIRRKRLKSYDDAALVNQETRTRKTAAVPTKHFWQAFRFSHPWKSHLPASSCITAICFVTKFPSKRKSTSYTPERKTWQRNQKPSIWRCISYWNMMIFHCHVSSSGGKYWFPATSRFLPGIFTPSIHATVQIPSSRDFRLEHWIHACAIQDISGRFFQGSSWDTPLNPKIPQKRHSIQTSGKKSDFFFSELYF